MAIVAAVFAGLTGLCAVLANVMNAYKGVGYQDVENASESAIDNDQDVAIVLASRFRDQIREGLGVLGKKQTWLTRAQVLGGLGLLVIIAEVIVALAVGIE